MNLNFVESNPIPVKASLALMGLCEESFRLPLCPPTEATREALREGAARAGPPVVSLRDDLAGRRSRRCHALPADALGDEARAAFDRLMAALESGEVRAAEPGPDGWRSTPG